QSNHRTKIFTFPNPKARNKQKFFCSPMRNRLTNKNLFVPQRESEQQTKIFSFPNVKSDSKQKFVTSPDAKASNEQKFFRSSTQKRATNKNFLLAPTQKCLPPELRHTSHFRTYAQNAYF
ncbi:MAG: hypothetical protein K2K67_10445, partial [Treponemataceae bacterium]|nr:hypothetical protein [Treponemataceae bacterium]